MTDEIDRRIIEALNRDGRRAYTSIAAQLEVSEATVRGRVARMQRADVMKIVALCNPLTMGHQPLRLMIDVREHTPRSVARDLVQIGAVNHVSLCAGAHDIYVEATCRDLPAVRSLVDEVRRVPGVAEVHTHLLTELYKDYSWIGLRGAAGQVESPEQTGR
ncbi:Lrp/AsnC family transcriptional regulator [Microbacterium fluvii]|uniref:Lrp/AsnC family transcriptional regulator n=1 Tax=Microbacterium fluvii TaxID=415215 RepID=A0ABW2HJX4_9MICO|nr:Lrp/AsnC family transcriptional regulator [Microbacterium fluvii]MCU4673949.1 Lrp/AsnC family transcriptional regulator [Microbacterium fluvii]